ncbi:hypothetical protein CALCODRAFT_493207 [Calocera cornea HHB12733]|uniref:Hypervirulence associated protein TUDOR domain-containing protein n=1 Tax=Calocera cornea HHB12733 TaxID=1353952 RepID=A0A165HTC4_9BASI|nr:hypothetical protein CALCODRAFT_493207 [Calocera cornea HHB12733]
MLGRSGLRPLCTLYRSSIAPKPRFDTTKRAMADNISEGDEVHWKWGAGTASGTVAEIVEDGKAEVTSDKGNTVTRNARGKDDPAVKIERKGNDVVKLAHELQEAKDA